MNLGRRTRTGRLRRYGAGCLRSRARPQADAKREVYTIPLSNAKPGPPSPSPRRRK